MKEFQSGLGQLMWNMQGGLFEKGVSQITARETI
jgi:hypothetical protein